MCSFGFPYFGRFFSPSKKVFSCKATDLMIAPDCSVFCLCGLLLRFDVIFGTRCVAGNFCVSKGEICCTRLWNPVLLGQLFSYMLAKI